MRYEDHTLDDQIAAAAGGNRPGRGPRALPPYSCKYARKVYTQHQLFALLALREFLKQD